MNFIPKDKIEWKLVKYLRQGETFNYDYELWLNEPLASWDVFDYWEREKTESIEAHLKKGDILFDVGVEQCWLSIVYAKTVGPENMVLIEPTREFWPNIKAIWEKNYRNIMPRASLVALISDKNKGKPDLDTTTWPSDSKGDIIDRNKYQYIHDNSEELPEITIDKYVELTGIIPNGIACDIEGAEMLMLKGAEQTLKSHKPKLFLSLHPDLGLRDYGVTLDETVEYLELLGYKGEFLGKMHEEFWYFEVTND